MTSITVTVGPSSIKPEILRKLIEAGAESFRINLSHSNKESLEHYFSVLDKEGITPAIDTNGAQLRVIDTNLPKKISSGEEVNLYFGTKSEDLCDHSKYFILLNHPEAFEQISNNDIIKVDFNGLALQVKDKTNKSSCIGKVISSGAVVINRAVDIKSKTLELSVLTEFDKYAIEYALNKGINEIYASFISNANQTISIRNLVGDNIKIISKIETALAVTNILEILDVSDKILVDRGDLSREISIPLVPLAVFNILKLAKTKNKPVMVATNVLDSMMTQNIPSRAEISDIFSHLAAGASGFVLAAEVAIGSNPVSSTALLKHLIELFNNHKNGLHGIGRIKTPSRELIGNELFNWL